MKWGDYNELSGWPQGNHESSQKRGAGGFKLEGGLVRTEPEIKDRNVSKGCRQLPGQIAPWWERCSYTTRLCVHFLVRAHTYRGKLYPGGKTKKNAGRTLEIGKGKEQVFPGSLSRECSPAIP